MKNRTKQWTDFFNTMPDKALEKAKDVILSNIRWNANLPNIFNKKEWDAMTQGAILSENDEKIKTLWKTMSQDKNLLN